MCDFIQYESDSISSSRMRCCACGVEFNTGPGSGHDCKFGTWVNE